MTVGSVSGYMSKHNRMKNSFANNFDSYFEQNGNPISDAIDGLTGKLRNAARNIYYDLRTTRADLARQRMAKVKLQNALKVGIPAGIIGGAFLGAGIDGAIRHFAGGGNEVERLRRILEERGINPDTGRPNS